MHQQTNSDEKGQLSPTQGGKPVTEPFPDGHGVLSPETVRSTLVNLLHSRKTAVKQAPYTKAVLSLSDVSETGTLHQSCALSG